MTTLFSSSSAADGTWGGLHGLADGTYSVGVYIRQSGYFVHEPFSGFNNVTITDSNSAVANIDFAIAKFIRGPIGSISGTVSGPSGGLTGVTVYIDANHNGIFDDPDSTTSAERWHVLPRIPERRRLSGTHRGARWAHAHKPGLGQVGSAAGKRRPSLPREFRSQDQQWWRRW